MPKTTGYEHKKLRPREPSFGRASRRRVLLILICPFLGVAQRISLHSVQTAKGFSWVSRGATHFEIFVESGSFAEREFDKIEAVLEASHARVEKLLGSPIDDKTQYFLVSSRQRMKELIGLESNGFAIGNMSLGVYNETLQAIGAHELCHVCARRLWGNSKGDWINEGLAVYSDDKWNDLPLHPLAKWLLDRSRLVPLGNLVANGWNRKYSDLVTYPELGSFVKFLFEKYGREAVKSVWQKGPKGTVGPTGNSLETLEGEWRAEIGKLDASSIRYDM